MPLQIYMTDQIPGSKYEETWQKFQFYTGRTSVYSCFSLFKEEVRKD